MTKKDLKALNKRYEELDKKYVEAFRSLGGDNYEKTLEEAKDLATRRAEVKYIIELLGGTK